MYFILKLVLIILLNETYAHIKQDTEKILLPAWNPTGVKEIPLTLKAFGQLIQLSLRRNDRIVSPAFEVWKYNAKSDTKKLQLNVLDPCYYYHEDDISSATINFCDEHGLKGFISLKNDALEIRPLRNDFAPLNLIDDICVREQINLSFGKPHLIKRSLQYFPNSNFYLLDNFKPKRRYVRNIQQKVTIELAVFFDEAAYHLFMPFLDNDKKKLRNMILAYVNNMQAAFHHPSLGTRVDISLVRLEIMEKQPYDLPVSSQFENEKYKLLNSFCKYATTHNPQYDEDPQHWDISLYITGMNLYGVYNGQKDYSTAAMASSFDGCVVSNSCAVVEFGVAHGKASAGFTSSLIAVHEIGHLLGMYHDWESVPTSELDSEPCRKDKYIMAALKFQRGQVTWSECSRETAKNLWKTRPCLRDHKRPENFDVANALDHSRYHDLPGREWTAKAQCELFLRDKDANVVTLYDICQVLECETPHKDKHFFAGSALDGTYCALGKECQGGECVPVIEPPYLFKYCDDNNWTEWKEDSCNNPCLINSKGVIKKRRYCKHHETASCDGPYYDVVLCNDSRRCTKRKTLAEYTTMKCAEFSLEIKEHGRENFISEPEEGPGSQALHDVKKPWQACIILCRLKHPVVFSYYSMHRDMLSLGINPYFPDGTWCHNKDGQDYYCRQHYCLLEKYSTEDCLLPGAFQHTCTRI